MIEEQLANLIDEEVLRRYGEDGINADLQPAQQGFGDFASNAAFKLASRLKRPPREIAAELCAALQYSSLDRAEVAGAGYINLWLKDEVVADLALSAARERPRLYAGKVVVTEYSDPNPFKVLHVGHLYTSIVGDAITNLLRLAGGEVHPVNFGGDVGLHVGKTLWAILRELGGERPEGLEKINSASRSEWMAGRYVEGTLAYEEDEKAKAEIIELNRRVYRIHEEGDKASPLAQIYWTCRGWSYDYFDAFYARIGVEFEKYYPESQTAPLGLATVREQLRAGVYAESEGAIIFPGEDYGLHSRVFINSQGLPTYEAKDVGLLMAKWRDYAFDRSVVITGNDITEYMKVVLKSVEQFAPEISRRSTHLTHGNVKLAGGVKMSSRKGNFLRAVDVLDMVSRANAAANGSEDQRVVLGAVKYAFLKQRLGSDLVFIPEESVSLDGNSGPYLQYAHARACSILAKASSIPEKIEGELEPDERTLAFALSQYQSVVERAVSELLPHHICGYLYDLAQTFNRFYERSRVLGDPREATRLALVGSYRSVLADGLRTLGIEAPERL